MNKTHKDNTVVTGYIEKIIWMLKTLPFWKDLLHLIQSKRYKAYLCGGCLRDIILERRPRDFDICIDGDPYVLAREFAEAIEASVVPLEKHPSIVRVVKKGEAEFDFSSMIGESIEMDLARRDFTINAMAMEIDLSSETMKNSIIDPFGGMEDLNSRTIRMIPPNPFPDDPVRLLRAFRLKAELNYEIEGKTIEAIKMNCHLIKESAPERIRDEWMRILSCEGAWCTVEGLDSSGILGQFLPEIEAMKGVVQNDYHHLDLWGHSLLALKNLESILREPPEPISSIFNSIFEDFLSREPVQGRPFRSILKFSTLLHDVGKPYTRIVDEKGRIRFFHHEREGEEIAVKLCQRLRFSKQEVRSLSTWVRGHMRPGHLFRLKTPSKRSIARFFRQHKEDFPALFLMFLADILSTRGPKSRKEAFYEALIFVRDMINLYQLELRPRWERARLIDGNDLIEIFRLKPGPLFSKILNSIELLYAEGLIKDREDAIRWIRENYNNRIEL